MTAKKSSRTGEITNTNQNNREKRNPILIKTTQKINSKTTPQKIFP